MTAESITAETTVHQYDTIPLDRLTPLWEMYRATFDTLATLAVQRHVMEWFDFAEVMADSTVTKYVAYQPAPDPREGMVPVGVGAQTNRLQSVPLIEPRWFAHRHPDLYEARKIWYVLFIGVRQDPKPDGAVFADLLRDMAAPAVEAHGKTFLDYCMHNEVHRHMPQITGRILRGQYGPYALTIDKVDAQSYYEYDFTVGRRS